MADRFNVLWTWQWVYFNRFSKSVCSMVHGWSQGNVSTFIRDICGVDIWYLQSPPYTTPFLQRSEGHEFLSIAHDPFAVVSGILAITHPRQYEMAKWMKNSMIASGDCEDALGRWPMVFTAISVISNRESPFHRDLHESWKWFDFLLSFRPYQHAPLYLANLGIRVNNPPGTICIFGGRALWHGVRRVSPRITLALYMRKNIQKELGIQSASWMTQHEYDSFIGSKRHNIRRRMPTDMRS